jgi:hypothetical protein
MIRLLRWGLLDLPPLVLQLRGALNRSQPPVWAFDPDSRCVCEGLSIKAHLRSDGVLDERPRGEGKSGSVLGVQVSELVSTKIVDLGALDIRPGDYKPLKSLERSQATAFSSFGGLDARGSYRRASPWAVDYPAPYREERCRHDEERVGQQKREDVIRAG